MKLIFLTAAALALAACAGMPTPSPDQIDLAARLAAEAAKALAGG